VLFEGCINLLLAPQLLLINQGILEDPEALTVEGDPPLLGVNAHDWDLPTSMPRAKSGVALPFLPTLKPPPPPPPLSKKLYVSTPLAARRRTALFSCLARAFLIAPEFPWL